MISVTIPTDTRVISISVEDDNAQEATTCLLYTSPSPRD